MSFDRAALDSIGASMKVVGQLTGVVVCAQHPDRTLSGKHRKREDPKVKVYQLDVDGMRAKLGISHEAYETLVSMHFNVQRLVGDEERRQEVLVLARQLAASGVPKDQVAKKLIELLAGVVGRSRVYELVDREFKDQARSEAVSGGIAAAKKEPFSKGLSELASQHVEKVNTPAKVKLLEIVNRAIGPRFRQEEAFDRGKKHARTGESMFYSVDAVLDSGVGLEAEGAGTSSDDPDREKFILGTRSAKGLEVKSLVHLPNDLILKYPTFVEEYVRLLYDASRALEWFECRNGHRYLSTARLDGFCWKCKSAGNLVGYKP